MPDNVIIFEKSGCPYCARARKHLRSKKIPFTTVKCKDVEELKEKIKAKKLRVPTTLTFPRVYKNNRLIGGSDDVVKKM